MRPLPARLSAIGLLLLIGTGAKAQQTTDIGQGNAVNSPTDGPAPYGNWTPGARHQLLVLASELHDAGMLAGTIHAVAFQVVSPAAAPLEGFTVRLGHTPATSLGTAWLEGLTTVAGPTTFIDQAGWNTHVFDTPFDWDGTSNLIIETCFRSAGTTFNAQFLQSTTWYNSTCMLANADPDICATPALSPFAVAMRPDLRFTSTPFPPQAAFIQSASQSCTGTIRFRDRSLNAPTSWHWEFGDGATADTPDATHTYAANGTYTATLTAGNALGSTTAQSTPIVVDLTGPRPVAACIPATPGTVDGFGIVQVTLNGEAFPSADAPSEGYADHSCALVPVTAGDVITLDVTTGPAAPHGIRAWLDSDDSGTFEAEELVLAADQVFHASAAFPVPPTAPIGVPLRLRVIADYALVAPPEPCSAPAFGQAEDYGILVAANTSAPHALFTATPPHTCTGTVQFTDGSLYLPTTWAWDFGDGQGSASPSPSHTYTASGTYIVTLTTSNAFGSDEATATVTVALDDALVAAGCIPQTVSACCGYGIVSFAFGDLSVDSEDGSEGYADRSCGYVAHVEEGHPASFSIITGGVNGHDVSLWLDADNDGTFTPGERLYAAENVQSATGTVLVPTGAVLDVPLRLRAIADVVGEGGDACEAPLFGQCEDYAVRIAPNDDPPEAVFDADPRHGCTGEVHFSDQSTGVPTAWSWQFGDGGTSTEASPQHTYAGTGTYDVQLTVTNANGSDTHTEPAFITVLDESLCDTLRMPVFNNAVATTCAGVLTDDGGPYDDCSPGLSRWLIIAPPGATSIQLSFSAFDLAHNLAFLDIYEGTDTLGLSLGAWTGSALPPVLTSATGAVTLQQRVISGASGSPGFLLNWDCNATGVNEQGGPLITGLWPQPASGPVTVAFLRPVTGDITVHDALGSIVLHEQLRTPTIQHTLETGHLAGGCYVLSFRSGAGRWARTLILR